MKKKILAVGVAAIVGSLSGVASAAMNVNENGIGHINVLPYYSVQEGNATLISITNTDTTNGKAVKVRFRGAKMSDDVFDFQIFLSPGDVWTGAVTQDGNVARMTTTDKSCTLPQSVNQSFVTARLLDDEKATGTREGYVEIINMGDIPSGSDLFTTIKHVNGVAPCEADVLIGTGSTPIDHSDDLTVPTTGLTTFATVINVPTSKAFTFAATALSPDAPVAVTRYWRQANLDATFGPATTSDTIFDPTAGNVRMYEFDLPDLSTPYDPAAATADDQRDAVTSALAKSRVITEYVTSDSILATTDVVLSQPTRRYYYTWIDEPDAAAGDTLRTLATMDGATGVYVSLDASSNTIAVGSPAFTDREERVVSNPTNIVISPNPQPGAGVFTIEGEVAVISINNGNIPTGSLNASLTAQDYNTPYADGWVSLSTTTAADSDPLPVIGFTAINVFNAGVGAAGTNYGLTLPLRYLP